MENIKIVKRMTTKDGIVNFGGITLYKSALTNFANALNYAHRGNGEQETNGIEIEFDGEFFILTQGRITVKLMESYGENIIEKYID